MRRARPLVTIVGVTAFVTWTVVPVLAQMPSGQSAQPRPAANPADTGKPGMGPGNKEKSEQMGMKGERKAEKHARKSDGKPETVAGQHGKQGRDNARTKQ